MHYVSYRFRLVVSAFTTHTRKGHSETFAGGGYVFYVDWGDGFTGVCIYLNSSNCAFLAYQLYLNKAKKYNRRDIGKLVEVLDRSVILFVIMVSQLFRHLQTHQLVQFNMCSSLYINYTTIKLLKKDSMS